MTVASSRLLVFWVQPIIAIAVIAAGATLPALREAIWTGGLVLAGGATVGRTVLDILRGRFASDIVAALAIVGAIVFGVPLAGLIVVLMQTGGEALERWAEGRATDAVRALEDSAPRVAHLIRATGTEDVTVALVAPGDTLLVRPGEMVPCDGVVAEGPGDLDLARLTGEAMPVAVVRGDAVRSGSVVIARPLVVRATAAAGESLYARIVELVREAQAAKAPLQRLADKWAVWFTPFTLAACAATYFVTGDPIRVLAVLVVATPCPLILAAPVAIIGGINSAARARVIVRTGGALERLAGVDTVAFDKTGTLTVGHPEVSDVLAAPGAEADGVLSVAASVEQHSGHPFARSIVRAAAARGLTPLPAQDVHEEAGRGVQGRVGGRRVAVGSARWVREVVPDLQTYNGLLVPADPAQTVAIVSVDGHQVGTLVLADKLRPELPALFRDLASIGVRRTVLLSGDRPERVAHAANALGITDAQGDLLPDGKVSAIRALIAQGRRVAMVGDGINDAPALGAATVGIALASHGGGIAALSADCVLLSDDLQLVVRSMRIAQRALGVARQSVYVGIGLSVMAMGFAAAGYLSPVAGALVQEAIDVAVILNALRAREDEKTRRREDEKTSRGRDG
jgi:heavy metal translocating P-type ATPase